MTPDRDESDQPQEPAPTREIERGGGDGNAPFVGETLGGRYKIEAHLGEGAMGAVYLAEHVRIGRRDAIKLLNPELADDEDAWARFTREARNASHINHPNVCTVYDFGETDEGLPFIAMEYVDGETLTRLMEREGPLPRRRVLELSEQILDALDAAHSRGIVHRDLKPENIMLVRGEQGSGTVKVVDFGIAKAVQDDEGRQDITREGFAVGTPQYVAPEQVAGGEVDRRSDLYSLGVVLYELLSGRLPFTGDSWREVMTKRLSEDPVPLRESAPELAVGEALERVIHCALSREPADRFEDAEAMRRALREAIRGGGAGSGTVPGTEHIGVGEEEAEVEPSLLDPSGWPAAWRRAAYGILLAAGLGGAGWLGIQALGGGSAGPASADGATDPGAETPPGQVAMREGGETDGGTDGGAGGEATSGTDDGSASGAGTDAGTDATAGAASGGGTNGGGTDGGGDGQAAAGGTDGGATDGTDGSQAAAAGGGGESGDAAPGGGDGGGATSAIAGWSAARVDSLLFRQQDALLGSPSSGELRGAADTARLVWEAGGQTDANRGFAAFILAQVRQEQESLDAAETWARRAVRLDPDQDGYQSLLDGLEGGGR